MCGIAGYYFREGQSDLSPDLGRVVEALQHRGPDAHGLFEDETKCVGIAHTRLAIIDLQETGAQPMFSPDSSSVLSFNGEIYNFRELRTKLELEGHEFLGTSDTEVLLRLLTTEGLGALPKLNGIFAFALYDRLTGELTLARDAYGVKPLYYCETNSGVAFGSELRALLAMGISAQVPEPEILGRYLSYLWNPGHETPSGNFFSLRPGEVMVIKAGTVIRKYSWFKPPILAPQIATGREARLVAQTARILRRAVHRQMVSDVPVGAFLSGGLDSSAVVAFAREMSPELTCFTIDAAGGPERGSQDDLPYARNVAKHLNVPLEVVQVDPSQMADDFKSMIWKLEEPLADPASLNVLYISRLAREQGIKVLMSGAGGDDLFTGYRRHHAVAIDRYMQCFPKPIRHSLSRLGNKLSRSQPTTRRIAKFLDGFSTEGAERLVNYFLWTQRHDVLELLTLELRSSLASTAFNAPMLEYLDLMPEKVDPINSILALEQRFFLANHNLVYTDKMSMAASIEVRVPFLDIELAAFAATLPPRVKQRGKEGKWILKKAMEPFLPKDVIYRPKSGFGVPLRRWLSHELKAMMHDLLSSESLLRRNYFDAVKVKRLIEMNEIGKIDASYTIFSLMCIEMWCRLFLDEPQSHNAAASNF